MLVGGEAASLATELASQPGNGSEKVPAHADTFTENKIFWKNIDGKVLEVAHCCTRVLVAFLRSYSYGWD